MTRRRGARGLTAMAAIVLASAIFGLAVVVSRSSDALRPEPDPTGVDLPADVVETKPAALDRPPPVVPPPPETVPPRAVVEDDALTDLRARGLLVPVAGVDASELYGSFDEQRGGSRRHEAIDILAPRHTPVVAVEDGTIAKLFQSAAGGTTMYQFDPDRRYVYYYAHLERYAPGLGEKDRVRRGQVVGYVGTSGNAPKDTPHLHFAIFRLTEEQRWWEGTPIDPFAVLAHLR